MLAFAGLAGCGSDSGAGGGPAAAADDRIDCRVGGAAAFERVCTVDRAAGPGGLELTLRAPDGGFRRVVVARDGRGVIAADGAVPARVTVVGEGLIEVTFGDDRYRLPATIKR